MRRTEEYPEWLEKEVNEIYKEIRKYMIRNKISLSYICDKLNLHLSYLCSRLSYEDEVKEKHESQNISFNMLIDICKLIKLPLVFFDDYPSHASKKKLEIPIGANDDERTKNTLYYLLLSTLPKLNERQKESVVNHLQSYLPQGYELDL